jgi:hypothetical protein
MQPYNLALEQGLLRRALIWTSGVDTHLLAQI